METFQNFIFGNISYKFSQKFGADKPVNLNEEIVESLGKHAKIEKILKAKKKDRFEILPSLTDLYDVNLKVVIPKVGAIV